jgi:hemerythrin-like domain-containing protein
LFIDTGGFELTPLRQPISIRGFSGFASRFAGREESAPADDSVFQKICGFSWLNCEVSLTREWHVSCCDHTKMKTVCDNIFDSSFESQMINAIASCLALEHGRFNEALVTLGAASASLASDPLDRELYARATQAWSRIKSDLWFHLELENALVFWWSGLQFSSGLDFVGELSREQREIRELVKQIESGAQKEDEAAVSQARAFVALTNLLDRHIERYEARVFLAIRKAVPRPAEGAYGGSPRRLTSRSLPVAKGLPSNL